VWRCGQPLRTSEQQSRCASLTPPVTASMAVSLRRSYGTDEAAEAAAATARGVRRTRRGPARSREAAAQREPPHSAAAGSQQCGTAALRREPEPAAGEAATTRRDDNGAARCAATPPRAATLAVAGGMAPLLTRKAEGATRGRSAGRVPPATGAPPHSPTAAPPFLSPRARRLCTEHVSVCASLRAPRLDGAPLRRALPRHATHTAAHHAPPPAPPHAARAPLPRRQQRLPASIVILINALAAPRLATSAHA
jgi:hypothetical protein